METYSHTRSRFMMFIYVALRRAIGKMLETKWPCILQSIDSNSHESDARVINRCEAIFHFMVLKSEALVAWLWRRNYKIKTISWEAINAYPDILHSMPCITTFLMHAVNAVRCTTCTLAPFTISPCHVKRNKSLKTCEQMHNKSVRLFWSHHTFSRFQSAQIAHEVSAASSAAAAAAAASSLHTGSTLKGCVNCLESYREFFLWVFPTIWKTTGTPSPRCMSLVKLWERIHSVVASILPFSLLLFRLLLLVIVVLVAFAIESIYYRTQLTSVSFSSWISRTFYIFSLSLRLSLPFLTLPLLSCISILNVCRLSSCRESSRQRFLIFLFHIFWLPQSTHESQW